MIILINCCIAVFLSSITGTILLGFWRLCRKRLSDINPLYVYSFLKVVCLGHLVPVAYLAVCVKWNMEKFAQGARGFRFPLEYTSFVWVGMLIVSVIWGILTILLLKSRVIKVLKRIRQIRRISTTVDDEKYLAIYQVVKEKLGIDREIPLRKSEYIISPFVSGLYKPMIIICDKDYSESSLYYVLTHELTHWKSKDLLWKKIVLWISAFQSYNPFCKFLGQEIDLWSEIHCDIYACREGNLPVQKYYGYILKQMEEQVLKKTDVDSQYLSSMLFENKKCCDVSERMFYMGKYQKRQKKKTLLAIISIAMLSLSGVMVSYAAGQQITKSYQDACEETLVLQNENAEFENDGLEEHVLMPGEYNAEDWIEGDTISLFSGVTQFNWRVPANDRMDSPIFYKSKNSTITISAESIDGKTLYVGIWEPSGIIRYVTTSSYVHHVFSLNSSGFHKVIVQNPNNTVAEVAGHYY